MAQIPVVYDPKNQLQVEVSTRVPGNLQMLYGDVWGSGLRV